MENLLLFLNNIHPLNEGLREFLTTHLQETSLSHRQNLLRAGQTCRHVYFINSGLLRCYLMKDELEITTWLMKEGDVVFSVESFYLQTPSVEYIQALEDTTLYYITFDDLKYICRKEIEFNIIRTQLTEYYYMMFIRHNRVLQTCNAKEKYYWFINNFESISLRVPQKYIASFLGIREETISRIRHDFARKIS